PEAWGVVQKSISETTSAARGWKLIVGILGTLWSASSGTSSLMTVLNFAYHVKERRPWWKARLVIAPLLTITLTLLMMTALGIVLVGDAAAAWESTHGWAGSTLTWKIGQWPIALFFVILGFAVLYYWAPDVKDQKWYWIPPGSFIGVVLWVVASALFRV